MCVGRLLGDKTVISSKLFKRQNLPILLRTNFKIILLHVLKKEH